jgi:hypothetical protein
VDNPQVLAEAVVDTSFAIRSLRYEELWKVYVTYPLSGFVVDSLGVPAEIDKNGVAHYQPVSVAQRSLRQLSGYRATGDTAYLNQVRLWMSRMKETATVVDDALYYPYTTPFNLHGRATDPMPLPWYSGMAQGQMLSALVRLYQFTGEQQWRDQADATFRSFVNLAPRPTNFAFIDPNGYYWIEEYPGVNGPDYTLNGYIYALEGVIEYYNLTKDPDAKRVVLAGLTTMKRYIPSYRVLGGISYYCLRHKVRDDRYHMHHVEIFTDLFRATGDPFFEREAELFYQDYHPVE